MSNQFNLVLKQECEIHLNEELIDYLKDKLISERIAREEVEEELDKLKQELASLKSNSSATEKVSPPHYVVAVRKENGNEFYYHLRRADNDKWLWSSKMYKKFQTALRDTQRTADSFGWEIIRTE